MLAKLAVLPRLTPIMLPDTGRTNIVPVDYVADALVALLHADGRDGQTFHLTAPKTIGLRGIYRGIAAAAGLPPLRGSLPRSVAAPCSKCAAGPRCGATWWPPNWASPARSSTSSTGPDLHLRSDPESIARHRHRSARVRQLRARAVAVLGRAPRSRPGPPRRPGRTAGRSARDHHRSFQWHRPGIGRRGRRTGCDGIRLARNGDALDDLVAEIRANGGQAYAFTCDVTDSASVEHTVKDILGRFDHVDYLVNNAGRSIRRSVVN